jgi:stage II sporulation protein D
MNHARFPALHGRAAVAAAGAVVLATLLGAASGGALAANPGVGRTLTMPTPSVAPTAVPTQAPSPTPDANLPAGVTPLSGIITFYGRGYGHGVGMSQHGARGRALAGQTAAEILAHYYQGTSLGNVNPAAPIRVMVLNAYAATPSAPLVVVGRGGSWTIEGETAVFPADARLTIVPAVSGWALTVTASDGRQLLATSRSGSFHVAPSDPGQTTARLEVPTKPTNADEYRGVLRILPGSTTISVVNELALDTYLRGVVPVEMPASWPAQALAAQAIAARSYAAYRLRPGVGTFDVYDDTRSQVYRGYLGEQAAGDAAIAATTGVVMMSGSSIANSLYHSTGGGATEHNENVFVSSTGSKVAAPVSYLRGSADRAPDGNSYDAGSADATWSTLSYPLATLSSWFMADSRTNVGALTGLDLQDRGVSGRRISVTLYGSGGSRKVSGDVFRAVFNASRPSTDRQLRSTLFALAPIP